MRGLCRTSLVCVVLLSRPMFAGASVSVATIQRGKRATALVAAPGRGIGSAFCVHAGGFFATSAQAVAGAELGSEVPLVLWPGEAEQRTGAVHVPSAASTVTPCCRMYSARSGR